MPLTYQILARSNNTTVVTDATHFLMHITPTMNLRSSRVNSAFDYIIKSREHLFHYAYPPFGGHFATQGDGSNRHSVYYEPKCNSSAAERSTVFPSCTPYAHHPPTFMHTLCRPSSVLHAPPLRLKPSNQSRTSRSRRRAQ